jgi:type IV secretion system protein VirB11
MMTRYLDKTVMAGITDDDVTEVYVNPHDGIVRYHTYSRGKVTTDTRIDAIRVEMFLNTVASYCHTTLGPERPSLQAELPIDAFRGSRLQGFVPPLSCGPSFTIRKPPRMIYSLDSYVQRGLLHPDQHAVLLEAIATRRNILVVGGTDSGKTTFANALLRAISEQCPFDRVVILEDTVELQCVASDHVALRSTADLSLAQLVKVTLRANPDRIVVGEVRDEAALDLLDAWATGHPGGCATLHATTPEGALLRLDRLAQRVARHSQRELIAETVHVIVVLAQSPEGRRVTDVVRVLGLDRRRYFRFMRIPNHATPSTGVIPSPPSVPQ